MRNKVLVLMVFSLVIIACSTVPITGRKQLSLISDSKMLPMAFKQYSEFLKENKISKNIKETKELKEVGVRISKAVDTYMRANGMAKKADSYKWEFNLIEDKKVNAWAMPGGKVVFYTGIMPIAKNEDGIATIMGHEIAHAFARHGAERMSMGLLQQVGGVALALSTNNKSSKQQQIWMTAYGAGSGLGMLKFSRTHESEADKLGMVFMIMAGYNPHEAVNLWIRMSKNGGKKSPEFLSTHPSDQTRIKDLKAWMPKAIQIANKYKPNSSS